MSAGPGVIWGTDGLGGQGGPTWGWQAAVGTGGADRTAPRSGFPACGWVPAGSERSQRSKQKLRFYLMTLGQGQFCCILWYKGI